MNALEMRIEAHVKLEAEVAVDEAARLNAKHVKIGMQATLLLEQQRDVFDTLMGSTPLAAEQHSAIDDLPRLARIERELAVICDQLAEVVKRQKVLDSAAEMQRRVKLAADLGATDTPIPGPRAAQMVLEHVGKAMSVPEVTRIMLEAGMVKLAGKTPEQTVSAYLSKAAKHGGMFVRIKPGSYDLRKVEA
jgi:hypothetical protein